MRQLPRICSSASLLLLVACGGGDDHADGEGGADGSSTSAGHAEGSSSTASGGVDGSESGGDDGLTHGVVKLELQRGESQPGDPFGGTATVVATMQYEECLAGFYELHPELRQDGAEGAAIFGTSELGGEGWQDRLCGAGLDNPVDCEVQAIVQDIDIVKQLTVVYAVSGALEGKQLRFGPLPTAATAMCGDVLLPIVRLSSNGGVEGTAENGTAVWGTESFTPATATTNQGAPIRIGAVAAGG